MPPSAFLRRPSFPGAPRVFASIEDLIDDALRTNSGFLNFVLTPVRDFVHGVLHPLFSLGDAVIGAVWGWVEWGWDRLVDLWADAGAGMDWLEGEASGFADWALSVAREAVAQARTDLTNFGWDIYNQAAQWVNAARADLTGLATNLWRDARQWASDLWEDGRRFAAAAADDVRRWAGDAVAAVDRLARELADDLWRGIERASHDAYTWATNAQVAAQDYTDAATRSLERFTHDVVDAFYRDVVRPLADAVGALSSSFGDFLRTEWAWVKRAERWVRWITDHAAGEAEETWRLLSSLDPMEVFESGFAAGRRSLVGAWGFAGGVLP